MNKKTIKAIETAVCEKWNSIGYGLSVSNGSEDCPLCNLFYDDYCQSCPVFRLDEKYYRCSQTPCREVQQKTFLSNDDPDMIDAVEQEIIFLCSLLPEDHWLYEKYE